MQSIDSVAYIPPFGLAKRVSALDSNLLATKALKEK